MNRAELIDQINSTGKLTVGNLASYSTPYALADLADDDLVTKALAILLIDAIGVVKTTLTKAGSDINTDGNIDVSADDIPTGSDLLAVYVDDAPVFSPVRYSYTTNLVYGFDTSIASGAVIILKFI